MTTLENLRGSRMSCWMVGKVAAPPNEKRMVPKARKNDLKPGDEWRAVGAALESRPTLTTTRMEATAVANEAPTAIGLQQAHRLKDFFQTSTRKYGSYIGGGRRGPGGTAP